MSAVAAAGSGSVVIVEARVDCLVYIFLHFTSIVRIGMFIVPAVYVCVCGI